MPQNSSPVVGGSGVRAVLCGGIGSGKSTAAECFADLGALVISADDHARLALAPDTAAARAVIERWPEVAVDGEIDRAALGRTVFADPAALAWVESQTHPQTRRSIGEAVTGAHEPVVIVEIPILRDWFDGWPTIVVDAPEPLRVDRVLERSGVMTAEDVRDVMARQPSRSTWLLAADFVIDNSQGLEHLRTECLRVWERLGQD